jgi:hypothetical protein
VLRHDVANGEYLLVQAALLGAQIEDVGILLIDFESNQLHSRFRRDFGRVRRRRGRLVRGFG